MTCEICGEAGFRCRCDDEVDMENLEPIINEEDEV